MSNSVEPSRNELLSSLTTIVSSYLNQNPIAPEKVPDFIGAVSRALRQAQETTVIEPISAASIGQTSASGRKAEVGEARASSPTVSETPIPAIPSPVIPTQAWATISEEPLPKPAVPIDESVTDDYIVCLEDGVRVKVLKRYLSKFKMTPQEYRTKWGLPTNYPMTAPAYAASRAEFARSIGLGKKKPSQTAAAAAPVAKAPMDVVTTPTASVRPTPDDAAVTTTACR
jgi:predicted transcriptional regulator